MGLLFSFSFFLKLLSVIQLQATVWPAFTQAIGVRLTACLPWGAFLLYSNILSLGLHLKSSLILLKLLNRLINITHCNTYQWPRPLPRQPLTANIFLAGVGTVSLLPFWSFSSDFSLLFSSLLTDLETACLALIKESSVKSTQSWESNSRKFLLQT